LDDPHICCDVVRVLSDLVYYVTRAPNGPCPYETPIGDFTICKCPIRQEIYNRYKM